MDANWPLQKAELASEAERNVDEMSALLHDVSESVSEWD